MRFVDIQAYKRHYAVTDKIIKDAKLNMNLIL